MQGRSTRFAKTTHLLLNYSQQCVGMMATFRFNILFPQPIKKPLINPKFQRYNIQAFLYYVNIN